MERKIQREKDKNETTKTGFVEPKCLGKITINEWQFLDNGTLWRAS